MNVLKKTYFDAKITFMFFKRNIQNPKVKLYIFFVKLFFFVNKFLLEQIYFLEIEKSFDRKITFVFLRNHISTEKIHECF